MRPRHPKLDGVIVERNDVLEWPDLTADETDHRSLHGTLEMILEGTRGKWLIIGEPDPLAQGDGEGFLIR